MEDSVDLVDEAGVTVALLANPLSWRVRAVEHVEIDSAYSCRRRRTLHCGPLRHLLRQGDERAHVAFLVLNVASVPRGPLLDFDVSGPFGPAFLLPRQEAAYRQALFIAELAQSGGLPVLEGAVELMAAAFGMPRTVVGWSPEPSIKDLTSYLDDGLGGEARELYGQWFEISRRCAQIIDERLDRPSPQSPTRLPVLAVPEYFGGTSLDVPAAAITDALTAYLSLLEAAVEASAGDEPTVGDDLLNSVADYGDNYDLMVATKVPLDEPFMLRYSERRSMSLSWYLGAGSQDLVVADAVTNHVAVHTQDASVEIHGVRALNPKTRSVTYGAFAVRDTRQFWSCYAHGPDRDYRMELHFKVRPLRRLQAVPYTLAAVLLLIAAAMCHEQVRKLSDLALIVGPSALAASLLLAREESTLAARLRFPTSLALTLALIILMGTAIALYLSWSPSDLLGSI